MAGAYKRRSDQGRVGGKWTGWWIDENGKRRFKAISTSKDATLKVARKLEEDSEKVRAGLIEPIELSQRAARSKAVKDHIEDYRLTLVAKGDTEKHARHIAHAIRSLLDDSSIKTVVGMPPDRIQEALGRLRAARSARTANHALGAVKAFVRWLHDSGRIKDVPRGFGKLRPYPVGKADRKHVRRSLSVEQFAHLIAVTEKEPAIVTQRRGRGGQPIGYMTGPERAIVYRIAVGTGFREEEIATLTPERFHLNGSEPTITVTACYSKRGKRSGRDDVQPISKELAILLRPWVAKREPGQPIFAMPTNGAEMFRADLKASGIPYRDKGGEVLDFHALRHTYISWMVARGVNPKIVQQLARHSTITLTLDRYTHTEHEDVRKAVEGATDA